MTVTALTHDTTANRAAAGLVLAVASAVTFGLSGALARGLLDTGWSAGAAVTLRTVIAAVVLLVPGLLALRGRMHLLRANAGLVTVSRRGVWAYYAVDPAGMAFLREAVDAISPALVEEVA